MVQEQLILDRYRPISEAGSGGFATVQLAWDTRIQRRVAIKCIQLKEQDVSQGVLPGLDEARTAAMLTDASIVGVYDFEVQGNQAYLIMEYVDGLTLTQLLHEYGNELSINVIAAIFSAVAHALEIAHDNQVLHLDIKPDNILINRQGQVKVTDFGLATLSDAMGFGSASGGTVGYMPLEQMRQESLDARCDEWALASVTYEVLTDENPFLAPDLPQAESAIEDAEIVLPSLCRDDLPQEADDVLFYALDPDRNERYDSVVDFAEEMERFLGSPVKGQRELAVLVGQAREHHEEEEELVEQPPVLGVLGTRAQQIVERVGSFLSVGILGFVALSNIPQGEGWTSILFWGVLVLLLLAAILKPHLGAILALLTFSVVLCMHEAYLLGALLMLASAGWWFFIGRKGDSQTNGALLPILFGSFGLNQISPLVIGFTSGLKEALVNTLFAVLLSITLAGLGSQSLFTWNALSFWNFSSLDVQDKVLLLLSQPATWCVIASWLLSAAALSLVRLRQTRVFSLMGVVVSTMLLAVGLFFAVKVNGGQPLWTPEWFPLASTIGAGSIMVIAALLFDPAHQSNKANEEDYAQQ